MPNAGTSKPCFVVAEQANLLLSYSFNKNNEYGCSLVTSGKLHVSIPVVQRSPVSVKWEVIREIFV